MSARRLLYLFGMALGLALFIWQAWRGISAVPAAGLRIVSPWSLLAAVGAGILLQFIQMISWFQVMRYLNVALGFADVARGYNISFLPRYIPGVVWGYLGRSEWLEQEFGTSYAVSMLGSFLEAAGLVFSALVVATLYAVTMWAPVPWVPVMVVAVLVAAPLLWAALPKATIRIAGRLASAMGRRISPDALELIRLGRTGYWWRAGALYACFWLLSGVALRLIAGAVLVNPSASWWDSAFAVAVSWVIGFVILFVPTGMGIREVTMTYLLGVTAGMPAWQGSAIALLARANSILAELLWLVVGAALFRRVARRRKGAVNPSDPGL